MNFDIGCDIIQNSRDEIDAELARISRKTCTCEGCTCGCHSFIGLRAGSMPEGGKASLAAHISYPQY